MTELRKRLNDLTEQVQQKRALDWPITSLYDSSVFLICRRMLSDAEAYLDDGNTDAAALSLRVVEQSLSVLTSLYALATEEI